MQVCFLIILWSTLRYKIIILQYAYLLIDCRISIDVLILPFLSEHYGSKNIIVICNDLLILRIELTTYYLSFHLDNIQL